MDELIINNRGIEAVTPEGERLLDIHHIDHPRKKYDDNDLVSLGFTSHYEQLRERFGDHMVDGSAGENIIIEYPEELWMDDFIGRLAIENQGTGQLLVLDQVQVINPCRDFSAFAAQQQDGGLPPGELKEILQFLGRGRRGFLMLLPEGDGIVRPGDPVYLVD